MKTPELKPCPFCGGKADYKHGKKLFYFIALSNFFVLTEAKITQIFPSEYI